MSAAVWLCGTLLGCLICAGAALAEEPALASLSGKTSAPSPATAQSGPAQTNPPAPAGQASAQATAEAEAAALVDLNRASAAELTSLPGIGQKRAEAILAFRAAHGGFHSVSQLLQIKGIGRAMLRKLRLLVTISSLGGASPDARVAQSAGGGGGSPPPHRVR